MSYDVEFAQAPRVIQVQLSKTSDTLQTQVQASNQVAVGNSDHRTLTYRDADDQHPISAITGLKKQLDAKAEDDEIQPLSNQDIEDLINSFV